MAGGIFGINISMERVNKCNNYYFTPSLLFILIFLLDRHFERRLGSTRKLSP